LALRGARNRLAQSQKQMISIAWLQGMLCQISGDAYPSLDELLGESQAKAAEPMSDEEVRANMRAWITVLNAGKLAPPTD